MLLFQALGRLWAKSWIVGTSTFKLLLSSKDTPLCFALQYQSQPGCLHHFDAASLLRNAVVVLQQFVYNYSNTCNKLLDTVPASSRSL